MIIYNDSLAHVPDAFSLLSYQAKWHVDKAVSGPLDKDFLVCLTFSSRSEITRSLNKYHQYWRPMNLCCRFWRESQWMNIFILSQSSLMSLFTVLHSFNFSSNDFWTDGSSDPHLSVYLSVNLWYKLSLCHVPSTPGKHLFQVHTLLIPFS